MNPEESFLEQLADLDDAELRAALDEQAAASNVSPDQLRQRLIGDWRYVGRPKQFAPAGAWSYWWLRSGRGFGKTMSAAQWAKKIALEDSPGCRFALIGPTYSDVKSTMVEGETGLLNCLPAGALLGQSREAAWNRSSYELTLANGTKFQGFSSERPDRLRGPQHHFAWGEEVSSWNDANAKADTPDTTWQNLNLGLRLGVHPRAVLTSTPKPNRLTKHLATLKAPIMRMVTGSSYENRANLSEVWWQTVVAPLEGTRTGRQEIEGEILEDVEGALWTRIELDDLRVGRDSLPPFERLVVAVDPNASSAEAANNAGIIVCARARVIVEHRGQRTYLPHGYVLADKTVTRGGPRAWAQAAVDAYYEYEADRVVAEKNNGGEMVELTIHTADPTVPVKLVSASRGKRTRAEPVASLYSGSDTMPPRVHHVGPLPELETEMVEWTPEADSPDRMDALVWGMTELLLGQRSGVASFAVPQGRIPTGAEVAAGRGRQ